MENYDIIKTIEIDDVIILVCKKQKQEYHKCVECKQCVKGSRFNFCTKYRAYVSNTDYCIEDK